MAIHWRRAIGAVVFKIELMSEFVQDEVRAVRRIETALFGGVPGENQRAHVAFRMPQHVFAALFPKIPSDITIAGHGVTRWVNQNRSKLRVVVRFAMEQEETRLCGDGNANLIGELEAPAALKVLFRQEHLNVTEEFGPISSRKFANDRNIARQDGVPLGRDRPGP